jgi:CheY-like chemotaxis protein
MPRSVLGSSHVGRQRRLHPRRAGSVSGDAIDHRSAGVPQMRARGRSVFRRDRILLEDVEPWRPRSRANRDRGGRGAQIRFSSGLGRGTSFKVFFPRVEEVADRPDKSPDVGSTKSPRGSEVILLVEDEDGLRRLLRTFLEDSGYKVLEARHGSEGLALCGKRQEPIDLLLTDIVMPKMGGRELAEQAKPLHAEMKVLFMSGYTDDTLILEGIEVRDTTFLQKPFTLTE